MRSITRVLALSVATVMIWVGLMAGSPTYANTPVALQQLNSEVSTLQDLVDSQDYLEIRSYIHGPMGMVRKDLGGLTAQACGSSKEKALTVSKSIATALEKLDSAALVNSAAKTRAAQAELKSAVEDLEPLVCPVS